MASAKNEAKIKFTAETTEFNKAIQSANAYLKQLRSELQLNATEMKNGGDQTETLKEKFRLLSEQFDTAGLKVEAMRGKVAAAVAIYGEGSNEVAKWRAELANAENVQEKVRQQLEQCSAEITRNVTATGNAQSAYAKLSSEIEEQERALNVLKELYIESALRYGENSRQAEGLAAQIEALSGELQNNRNSLENAQTAADSFDRTLDESGDSASDFSDAVSLLKDRLGDLDSFATGLVKGALREFVDLAKEAVSGVVDSGIEYENAFAGIRKTVDMSAYSAEEAEARFDALSDGLKAMSEEMPTTSAELAAFGEIGGQMGVELGESNEIMLGFIRTVADLQVATNIVGEEGAQSMAQFAEVTGMAQSEFSNFGSAIVDLGNNLPTTEADILEMATRLAGAGAQAGMTEAEILGLAAGLSSVGMAAEAGGSALSRVIASMQVATSTSDKLDAVLEQSGMTLRELELLSANNSFEFKTLAQSLGLSSTELNRLIKSGTQLEDFATVAGMTGEEFKKAFEEDAAGALVQFVLGLADTNELGESATSTLQEMGITQLRVSDTLRRASNAAGTMTEALEISTTAWEENTALTREAETFYGTTGNEIEALKNTIQNIGIELFERFSPYMKEAVEATKGWLQTDEAKEAIDEIGDILEGIAQDVLANLPEIIETVKSAAEGIPTVLNSIATAISWVVTHIDEIVTGIKAAVAAWALVKATQVISSIVNITSAIGAVALGIAGVTTATTALGAAINFITGLGVIGIITGVVVGITKLVQWIGELTNNTAACKEAISAHVQGLSSWSDGLSALSPSIADVNTLTSSMGNTISDVETEINDAETAITNIISQATAENRQLRQDEIASIEAYNQRIAELEEERLNVYRTGIQLQTDVIRAGLNSGQQMTVESMQQSLVNLNEALSQAETAAQESYNTRIQQTYAYHQENGTLNTAAYEADLNADAAWRDQQLALAQQSYAEGYQLLLQAAQQNISADMSMWTQMYDNSNAGREAYTSNLQQMNLEGAQAFLALVAEANEAGVQLSTETTQMANSILTSFANVPSGLQEIGVDALLYLIDGIDSQIPGLEDTSEMTAAEIVTTVQDYLGRGSDAKTYQLGQDATQGLADGMESKQATAENAASNVARGVVTSTQDTLDEHSPSRVMHGLGENAVQGLANGMESKKSIVNTTASGIARSMIQNATPDATAVKGIGENLATGIDAGMNNKSSWLGSRISSFASGLVNKFKSVFNIGSPSKVMADEIGAWLPAGIGEGFEANADAAIQPLRRLLGQMSDFSTLFDPAPLALDVNTRIADHMDAAAENNAQYAIFDRLLSAIQSLENLQFAMYINDTRIATATAGAADSVSGTRLNLKNRGIAL